MSWHDAKQAAQERLRNLPLPAGELTGLTVILTDFADEQVYRFVTGSTVSLKFYKMVNSALVRLLRHRKATVATELVTLADVLRHINQCEQGDQRNERAPRPEIPPARKTR
jgi:hypothetical protein